MKRTATLLGITLSVVLILSITMLSCQSSAAAEAGSSNSAATTVAVAKISSTCISCHNSRGLVVARNAQRSNSLHVISFTFQGGAAECTICHSSEGFTERIAAGTFEISADIKNPSPINCRTCHKIHKTYTSSDWALTTDAPVILQLTGDTFDEGKGNLCVNCHQARPGTDVPQAGGGNYEITSTSFGPHHRPQSSMLLGVGGYGEYKGSNVHYDAVDEGCISCHMTDTAVGKVAGGHTMNITYEAEGEPAEFLTGCLTCHEDIESLDRNGVQTEIAAMIEKVRVLLVKQGLIVADSEPGAIPDGVAGTFTSEQAGALWNFKTVMEDRSEGIHNPGYTKFLLQTALDALNKK